MTKMVSEGLFALAAAAFLAAASTGCSPRQSKEEAEWEKQVEALEARLARMGREKARTDHKAAALPVEAKQVRPAPADLCWQDYCPCDPPQGGPDQMICRNLKAGIPVEDEMMSIAAGMRDARRQIKEFEEEHEAF